jgi:hypothetical protein
MSKLNLAALERFDKVPATALTDLSPSETSGGSNDLADNIISESEIFETGEHTKQGLNPINSDLPNQPTSPNQPTPLPGQGQGLKLGSTVSGKFAVDMTDVILPALLVWVVSMLGYGFEKKQLALTAKEKETLTPLVQAYLDSVNIQFNNPLHNLLFGLAMVYGSKIVEIIPTAKKLEKKGKPNPVPSTAVKVVEMIKKNKTTDEIIEEIGKKRKKGIKDAINYFNANKKEFARENEPDIKLP